MSDINGTVGADTLTGTANADLIHGLAGDDTIKGATGDDVLYGDEGGDTLEGGAGADTLYGGDGNDYLNDTGGGDDRLYGGAGADSLSVIRYGGMPASTVTLDGGAGDDQVSFSGNGTGDASISLLGSEGDDTIRAGSFRQGNIDGGAGRDTITVSYSTASVTINAGSGDDVVAVSNLIGASIDLGEGADQITFNIGFDTTANGYTASLGAGADTINVLANSYTYFDSAFAPVAITDFEAGDGGDSIGFATYTSFALRNWDRGNPFGEGYLRLVQNGADTLLQVDRDAAGATFIFKTFLTLRNVQVGALTAFNVGGYPGDGSAPAGLTINGSDSAETFSGSRGADVIHGGGGNDVILGGDGNDLLYGEAGDDQLSGDYGNDVLQGGDGADTLKDEAFGNDTLYGEDGNDLLTVRRGSNYDSTPTPNLPQTILLDGGAGDDFVLFDGSFGTGSTVVTLIGGAGADTLTSLSARTVTVDGGEGPDKVTVQSANLATILTGADNDVISVSAIQSGSIDAGPGADQVTIDASSSTSLTITLGDGADLLSLTGDFYSAASPLQVLDFQTGDAGDRLDFRTLLDSTFQGASFPGWDGGNPFAQGYLRLVQSGADVLLQIDRDAGRNTYAFATLLILRNVQAGALTPLNLSGYPSDGSVAPGYVINGGLGRDIIQGSPGPDTIHGFEGADQINGGNGDDIIYGDDGNDNIDGGRGSDVCYGGAGDDQLFSNDGGACTTMYGEDGNDNLYASRSNLYTSNTSTLDGGSGNDTIFLQGQRPYSTGTLVGGTGDDSLTAYHLQSAIIFAGDGSDKLTLYDVGTVSINAGVGDDYVTLQVDVTTASITLSEGRDILQVQGFSSTPPQITVTDFESGDEGDQLRLFGYLVSNTQGFSTFQGSPIATGYLRAIQNGADTLVQVDRDAFASTYGFATLITLQNVSAATLTAFNFALTSGTAGADVLTGGPEGETLSGLGGDDVLSGRGGADTLIGGGGGDTLTGGAGADLFNYAAVSDSTGAAYDTITDFATGSDRIDVSAAIGAGGAVSISRGGGSSVVSFQGATGAAGVILVGGAVQGSDLVLGANTTAYIAGSSEGETIVGSAGVDVITGGGGGDTLTGGAGADLFNYAAISDSTGAAYDTITDFATGSDRIDVSAAIGAGGAVSISRGGGSSVVSFQGATGAAGVILVGGAVQGSDLVLGANTTAYIAGSSEGETIVGSAGVDVITGGGGRDYLTGGAGADVFRYASVADSTQADYDGIVDFTTGVDKIDVSAIGPGASVSINLYGGQSVVGFQGASGPAGVILTNGPVNGGDLITGPGSVIFIAGGGLSETITGSSGIDLISGGGGADVLTGGAGADVFRYFAASESTAAAMDVITDFATGVDQIDLRAVHTSAADAFGLYVQGADTYLLVDQGGDGLADMFIRLAGVTNVQAADILF